MATPSPAAVPKPTRPRWYAPTPTKFLFAVLAMQGVLFLSAHYRWFWFNERKGYTVLIAVAATAVALLLLVAAVAVSRFVKSKSQFSLATLLLMVPVMAIPTAWLGREMDLARKQREAMASSGLNDKFDPQRSFGKAGSQLGQAPRTLFDYDSLEVRLRPWLGEHFFREPKVFVITRPEFLPLIRNMTKLELLVCVWGEKAIGDEKATGMEIDLADLHELRGLQQLNIVGCRIVGSGLEPLLLLSSLQNLTLLGTNVTDQEIATLTPMKQLKRLNLSDTQLTDAGLIPIRELGSLEHLWLVRTAITDAGLEHIRGLDQLRMLNLSGTQVTDAGLEHLKGLAHLEWVSLKETKVSDVGIKALKVSLPYCRIEH